MAAPANSDTELLTEHFGYPPVSLLDDIINSVNILAEKALDSVEKALLGQPPASLGFRPPPAGASSKQAGDGPRFATAEEAHRHEVENGTHQLETLLCASIDRNFDKFELYVMRNILVVRPEDRDWVRLAHYEGLTLPTAADGADAPTAESINALRRKLQASQRLTALLHAEKARGEVLLRELRAAAATTAVADGTKGPLGFLRETGGLSEGDARTPLGTTAAFALSQLQALRALSTSLRGVLPDLAGGPSEGGPAGGGWRRERLEYIEGAARKHLEGTRGLELGPHGEVRDGEWQGEGRNLAQGEVEGLEKVVTILGPGPESASKADDMDES